MRSISFPGSRWLLASAALCLLANHPITAAPAPVPHLSFVENKAQWPAAVRFKASVPGGDVYLRADGLTYDWHSAVDLARVHAASAAAPRPGAPHSAAASVVLHGHAVYVDFVGAQPGTTPAGEGLEPARHNYFLGSNPASWASDVRLYEAVGYQALYPGVGLRVYGAATGLKYDFTVAPGASAAPVALRYRGAAGLALRPDGALRVRTSVTDVLEQKPYAYQTDAHGQRRAVACRYRLAGNTVRYEFPQGYDHTLPLVIDPAVVACTYSGSTGEMFGAAAGYDKAGNIFTGSMVQQPAYPNVPGDYLFKYGATTNIVISKLNPTGTTLLYTTYLGGNDLDEVRSLVASPLGDLYVLAQTKSTNFPTPAAAYSRQYSGNTDLAISKISSNGGVLLGATYLGGKDYESAGDLALGSTGMVYVVGNTSSNDFPVTATAYARTFKGVTDAFVARFNAELTNLDWSTFLGGSGGDQISALGITATGQPVVAGTTGSADFPVTAQAVQRTFRAPIEVFITRLRADGTGLEASTFFGAADGGETLASLQLDAAGNVYLLGNVRGTLAATPGAVTAVGGTAFISKLSASLAAVYFTARPAMGNVVLTAFGLDACENIYAAGFTNTSGLPLINALPNGNATPSTTSNGCYALTLSHDATKQLFGSYFGPAGNGSSSSAHSHSPVHRFDAQGRLYQVFCSAGSFYPATPGAYAATNRTGGFDVVVAKIDQGAGGGAGAAPRAAVAAVDSACAPYRVAFTNGSTGTGPLGYRWEFGDGTAADTARRPQHTFAQPGRYWVKLVVTAAPGCGSAQRDSTFLVVRVKAAPTVALPKNLALCPGSPLLLTANSPGNTYRWSTGATTASISVTQPGKYVVAVSNGSCTARDSTVVQLVAPPTLPADTTGCALGGVALRAAGAPGSTYLWSTQETTARIVAPASGRYTVRVTQNGCTTEKTVNVTLFQPVQPPNVITPNGDGKNDTFQLSAAAAVEPGTSLHIFTRWGQRVYTSADYRNDWGAPGYPAGLYYYVLENSRFCVPRTTGWLEVVK